MQLQLARFLINSYPYCCCYLLHEPANRHPLAYVFFLSSSYQMKKMLLMLPLLAFAFFAKGQNKIGFDTMVNTMISSKVDTISSTELVELIDHNKIVLLDSRQKVEYEVSHLPGANYVGYDDFDLKSVADIPKSDTIVVYCSIGKRSGDIGEKLRSAGYENVLNLYGGIFDWTNRGMEVVNDKNEPVKCVHPYNSIWGLWVNNYEKCYESR